MLTMRLQRRGRKNDPSFRVILVESKRAAKTGNFQEVLGNYDPRTDRIELKADRIKHWLGMGATVSDTLHNILVSQKIIDAKKINVLPRKSPPPAAEASAEETKKDEIPVAVAVEAEPTSAPESSDEAKGDNAVAAETPAQ